MLRPMSFLTAILILAACGTAQRPGAREAGAGGGGAADAGGGGGDAGGVAEGEGEAQGGEGEAQGGEGEGEGEGGEGEGGEGEGGEGEGGQGEGGQGDGGEGEGEAGGELGGEAEGGEAGGGEGGGEVGGGEVGGGEVGGGEAGGEMGGGETGDDFGHGFVADTLSVGGEAFDLDGDGRGDNALGVAAAFVNPELASNLGDQIILLIGVEAAHPVDDGPFDLNVLSGLDNDGDPSDNLLGGEEFDIDPASLNAAGDAMARADDADLTGGILTAAPGMMEIVLPIEGENMAMTLSHVQIEAEVVGDFESLINGRLGGAADADQLRETVEAMPLEPMAAMLIQGVLESPDIDTDDDGEPDAFSVVLSFTAVDCEFGEIR